MRGHQKYQELYTLGEEKAKELRITDDTKLHYFAEGFTQGFYLATKQMTTAMRNQFEEYLKEFGTKEEKEAFRNETMFLNSKIEH